MFKFTYGIDETHIATLEYMGKLRIEFHDIGEDYNGDFEPSDPDDKHLLCFDVQRVGSAGWEPMENGSYCTAMPVGTEPAIVMKRALALAYDVYDCMTQDMPIKGVCEAHSFMDDITNV